MSQFFDELETRRPERRAEDQFAALSRVIGQARHRSAFFARLLAGIDPPGVADDAALARLPVTRKSEMVDLQRGALPFGGLATVAPGELARIYQSPGPIYDPEARRPDYWRFARALHAAGFRAGELVHNSFSYHLTPAGMMIESGAHALGCAVIPAGTGNTELQARAVADLRPQGYGGTPSFLKILLDKAAQLGVTNPLTKALVSGEALPPALRDELAGRGVAVLQCYGTADLGLVAYESPAREGMIIDEGVIVEIVRPGTGDPVPEGEVGEVVVTALNPDYPLIRFATGDLSAMLPGPSPCGRTNRRIRGWMGRADQSTKVKGMFVMPRQIAELARRHGEIGRARLVVERDAAGADVMTLHCEVGARPDGLAEAIATTLQAVTKLKGAVVLAMAGELPNDGKVIDDRRPVG